MLVIRFQRVGRRNDPAFRVVVTERRSKPKTSGIEQLGSYHPKTKETHLKADRILYWLSKGAKASPRVHNLIISKGVIRGQKINVARTMKPDDTKEQTGLKLETPENTEAGKGQSVDVVPTKA